MGIAPDNYCVKKSCHQKDIVIKQRKCILVSESLITTHYKPKSHQATNKRWGSSPGGVAVPALLAKHHRNSVHTPVTGISRKKSCCTGKVNTRPGSRHETAKGCSSRIDIIGSTSQGAKLAKDLNATNKQPGSRYESTKGSNKQKDIRAGKFKESCIVSTNNKHS